MFNIVVDIIQIFLRTFLPSDSIWRNPFFMEVLFWAALAPVVFTFWKWQPAWLNTVEHAFVRFSRRKMLAVVAVGLAAIAVRVAVLPIKPVPTPAVHDEFSYLLQAQTFNAGRLTNPPHPMWVHFETMHVNMLPTYQSMYPPGQAAFLAAGARLTGEPWFGVLLGLALMCAAITWMLQGWMPPQWALLGGIFCVLRFAIFGRWVDTFYGGGVAALGGALVLGALPRIRSGKHLVPASLLFAVGLVLMANTRQYEGLLLSLVPLGWLVYWLIREGRRRPKLALQVVTSGMMVLLPAAAFMLYYNYRGTGHALTMPYVLNQQTYHITKPFFWQERYPIPEYRHFEMRKFYIFHELPDYLRSRELWGLEEILALKIRTYYGMFIWPLLFAAVFAIWTALKSPKLRLLPLAGLAMMLGVMVVIWQPESQYPAPATAVLVAILVLCVRLARTIRFDHRALGRGLARAMVVSMAVLLLCSSGYSLWNPADVPHFTFYIPQNIERARIVSELQRTPGQHLIIVHRAYYSWPGFEWVYNDADIDASRVVWARDMGDELNQRLIDYFKDRRVWLFDADTRHLAVYQPSVPTRDELVQFAPVAHPADSKKKVH